MEIKSIQENKDCDANVIRKILNFEENITKEDVFSLAKNRQLIFNEDFPIPHFKIIAQNFIIRGSIETKKISIDFDATVKDRVEILMEEIIKQIRRI